MLNAPDGRSDPDPLTTLGSIAQPQDPCSESTDTSRSAPEPNRSPSGLGRGLAGILGDALSAAPSEGVDRLVGVRQVRRSPEVRSFVTATALQTIAQGFGADGVVMVRRLTDGTLDAVTSQLPAGWTALSPVTFETVGRLHRLLEVDGPDSEQLTVGSSHLLLCRHVGPGEVMAAAVVRSSPFDDASTRVIGNLVRSVGAALADPAPPVEAGALRVLVQDEADGVLVDVRLSAGGQRRHAAAVARTAVEAVATAAAELCDADLRVAFAGALDVDDRVVTLAVVTGAGSGPLFGLAIDEPGTDTGPAEAVFAAARVIGVDPFAAGFESDAEG